MTRPQPFLSLISRTRPSKLPLWSHAVSTARFLWNTTSIPLQQTRHLAATSPQATLESPTTERTIIVTDRAVKQLYHINAKEKTHALRIEVDSGGCHGYQVKMELTSEKAKEDDLIIEKGGAKVIVDSVSMSLIAGSKLDYVEELIGSSFRVVDNPKAESSCGCKTSFNIKL
ncbi:hypothetical protein SeMB42_g02187 [Synchytrium endobioticum]|uniref:Core domain-containing protein n=1 Tax=Synchytrium endobioticum TaxID=286115 RepID=A0A507DG99_9FUNG|nr:hypothetical protein SeMB42_g02187 [Synchytrium endobioticum]